MLIDRKKVEALGKNKDDLASDNQELFTSYRKVQYEMMEELGKESSYEVANITNGIDHWLQTKKEGEKDDVPVYLRGEILLVDLGSFNFSHELKYPHPCVLLAQTKLFALVLPCTTKKYDVKYKDVLDATEEDGFATKTGLILYGTRWIAKTRIIHSMGIASQEILEKIAEANLIFQPEIQNRIKKQNIQISSLNHEIKELKKKINKLENNNP